MLALRALFAGRPWPGGRLTPELTGPLLPPGSPPVWVGGTKETAIGVAARSADGWNAWGLDAETFVARAADLARLTADAGRDPAEVPPTWGGIMLLGRDAKELATLEAERAAKGLGMDIWRGTSTTSAGCVTGSRALVRRGWSRSPRVQRVARGSSPQRSAPDAGVGAEARNGISAGPCSLRVTRSTKPSASRAAPRSTSGSSRSPGSGTVGS